MYAVSFPGLNLDQTNSLANVTRVQRFEFASYTERTFPYKNAYLKRKQYLTGKWLFFVHEHMYWQVKYTLIRPVCVNMWNNLLIHPWLFTNNYYTLYIFMSWKLNVVINCEMYIILMSAQRNMLILGPCMSK